MKSLNRVFIMGHLGRAPELRVSQKGKTFTHLRIATNRSWIANDETSGQKERKEQTDWHSVFVWGPMAERCAEYLQKGSLVFVEGSLAYWQASDQETTKNAVHAHDVRFLSTGRAGNLDNQPPPRNHNAVAHPL